MNKHNLFVAILFCCICASAGAQTLEVAALKSFSPSVIREVFDIARYVKLDGDTQVALACAFEKEDAAFVEAVEADGGILSVKSARKLEKMRDRDLAAILSDEELKQYYRGVYDAEALAEGNAVGDKLRKKYNLSDQNWKFIRIAFYKIGLESRVINKLSDNPAEAKKKIAAIRKEQLATIEAKGGIRVNDDMTVTVVRPFDPNALHKE